MGVDAATFKRGLAHWASGVSVVTLRGPGGDHGMTASAVCSVSLDPPLVLVCVKKGNRTHGLLKDAGGFCINILAEGQADLSNRFAGWGWPEGRDRFEDLECGRAQASGAAILPGVLAALDCTLHAVHDGGDHDIFLGEVQAVHGAEAEGPRPLLYFHGAYRGLGDKL